MGITPAKVISIIDMITEATMLLAALSIFIAMWKLAKVYHKKNWLFPTFSIGLFVVGSAIDLIDEFYDLPYFIDKTLENGTKLLGITLFSLGIIVIVRQLIKMATTDVLTGVYNRRYLLETLPEAINTARQERQVLTVIFIDIDHFKEINDTMGHMIGDVVLLDVVMKLKATIGQDGLIARFGGDEFVILLPKTSLPDGEDLLKEMNRLVSEMRISGGRRVSISSGMVQFPEDGDNSDQLLRVASRRLLENRALNR